MYNSSILVKNIDKVTVRELSVNGVGAPLTY
nr:MAG TPA: hypothetical protein [Caudoviricetes sp.]